MAPAGLLIHTHITHRLWCLAASPVRFLIWATFAACLSRSLSLHFLPAFNPANKGIKAHVHIVVCLIKFSRCPSVEFPEEKAQTIPALINLLICGAWKKNMTRRLASFATLLQSAFVLSWVQTYVALNVFESLGNYSLFTMEVSTGSLENITASLFSSE